MKRIFLALVISTLSLWTSGVHGREFNFPEIAGWRQSAEIQTFTPKTLFEYIDGASDLYLMYDFQELKVAEYKNENKASLTIEVYQHKTPTDAFGVYSQERLPDANLIEVGAQGYIETNILNFLTGRYYVKMASYHTGVEDREILLTFAKRVSENLAVKGTLPPVLSSFPEEGKKKNSEKFINQNFLGYSFLHSAFTADYELSGKKFKLFVIQGADQNDCKEMIQQYFKQTKTSQKDATEGHYSVLDPYHGEIDFNWRGPYIWGTVNLNDPNLCSKYLKRFEAGLDKGK